jgi:hypothetical protein
MREMRGHIEVAKHNESFCATWNSSHYELALETFEESACGECGCERPPDRAVGAEYAGGQVAAVIERTLRTTPVDATHWSIRSRAAEPGFSYTTIRRTWATFDLQPHRSQTFKLSSDPLFVDKVCDIVGLNLSPPKRALVLSIEPISPEAAAEQKI